MDQGGKERERLLREGRDGLGAGGRRCRRAMRRVRGGGAEESVHLQEAFKVRTKGGGCPHSHGPCLRDREKRQAGGPRMVGEGRASPGPRIPCKHFRMCGRAVYPRRRVLSFL